MINRTYFQRVFTWVAIILLSMFVCVVWLFTIQMSIEWYVKKQNETQRQLDQVQKTLYDARNQMTQDKEDLKRYIDNKTLLLAIETKNQINTLR